MVIAYLMKLRGWRLAEAYKWVKDKRAVINITPGAALPWPAAALLVLCLHKSLIAPGLCSRSGRQAFDRF